MHIALDAFGSDRAPGPEVQGAVLALKEHICQHITLCGPSERLAPELDKCYYDASRLTVLDTPDIITMNDSAASSARHKQNSSLVQAVKLHASGKADAVVSLGNTGAVAAASLFTLGRIPNVLRPAIAITMPTQKKPCIILDVGANVDCTPTHLLQFAELGSLYSKFNYNIAQPRVALLNIGEEDKKGNELTKATFKMLKQSETLNFTGNIEGKDVLKGDADVIVCDGFVGNVILKTIEGAAVSIFSMMKQRIERDWIAKIGALLSFPVYAWMKKKLDYQQYGGALLAGVNGLTVIGHGRSNALAVKNAIRFAANIANTDFLARARQHFS